MSTSAPLRVGPFWVESWPQLAVGAAVLLVAIAALLVAFSQPH